MHFTEFSTRICQPEKVMFTEANLLRLIRLGKHRFRGLTNLEVNLGRMRQLYNVINQRKNETYKANGKIVYS